MLYNTLTVKDRHFVCITGNMKELTAKERKEVLETIGSLPEICEGVWEYSDKSIENKFSDYDFHDYPKGILEYMKESGYLTNDEYDDED